MKKQLKYFLFALIVTLFFTGNVSAASIRETIDENGEYSTIEPGALIVGITKFSSDTVLTTARVSKAGFNDAVFKINNDLPLGETQVYVFGGGTTANPIWFAVDETGETSRITENVPTSLDVYYVDNVEKVIDVEYTGTVDVGSLPSGISYDNNDKKLSIPATQTQFQFKTSEGGIRTVVTNINTEEKEVKISEIKYSITYLDSAGKIIGEPVLYGTLEITKKPANPTQEYDTFNGWKIKGTDNFYVFGNKLTGNIELQASFTDASFINVNLNYENSQNYKIKGVTISAPLSNSILEVKNSLVDPTRTDYDFMGWFIDAKCTNAFDINSTTISNDMTIYAKWQRKWYTTGLANNQFTITNQDDLDYLIENIEEVNKETRKVTINNSSPAKDYELSKNFTIHSNITLTINTTMKLTGNLNVDGTLINNGTIVGTSDTTGIITGDGTLTNNSGIKAAVRKSLMEKYTGEGYVILPSRDNTIYLASESNKLGNVTGTGGKISYTLDNYELTITNQEGELISIATNPSQYGSDAAYWLGFRLNMPTGTTKLSTRKWYKKDGSVYTLLGERKNDTSGWDFDKSGTNPGWAFYQPVDKGGAEFIYQTSYLMGDVYNFESYKVNFDVEEKDLSKSINEDLGTITLNKENFTIDSDIAVLADKKVTISENTTVTIPTGKTLTVNGTLDIKGTLVVNGTLVNNNVVEGNIVLTGTLNQNADIKNMNVTMNGNNALIKTPFNGGSIDFAGTSAGTFTVTPGSVIKTVDSSNENVGATLIEIVSGTTTLNSSHIIIPNSSLTIGEGATFIIPAGKAIYNYGAIINNGKLVNNGTLIDYNDLTKGALITVWGDIFTTADVITNRGISGTGIFEGTPYVSE